MPNDPVSVPKKRPISRRTFALGAITLAAGGGLWWRNFSQLDNASRKLDAPAAYAAAAEGKITLIDIRRPDEWERTGVPKYGYALDMRRPDFTERLKQITALNPGQPVAVICARGVRSRRLAARLIETGFIDVIDVPEGMLGSFSGPGWVKRGLPVRAPTDQEKASS